MEDKKTEKKFIVRLWDMFDGWINVSGPLSEEEAQALWNKKTNNGTKMTKYSDGDYYRIFPAGTRMIFTPDFLGR